MRKITFITIIIFCCGLVGTSTAASLGRWSEYETLNDNAANGIDFSWKRDCRRLDDKACNISWKWWNRYNRAVRVSYRIYLDGEQGKKAENNDLTLPPGESAEFSTIGERLLEVQVGVEKKDVQGCYPMSFEMAQKERVAIQKEARQKEQIRRLQEEEKEKILLSRQMSSQSQIARERMQSNLENEEKERQLEALRQEEARQIEEIERQATKQQIVNGIQELTQNLNAGIQKVEAARNNRIIANQPHHRSEVHAPPGPTMEDIKNSPLISSGSTVPGPQPDRNKSGRDNYGSYSQELSGNSSGSSYDSSAENWDMTSCVKLVSAKFQEHSFDQKTVMTVRVRNDCTENIKMSLCIEQSKGPTRWACSANDNAAPGYVLVYSGANDTGTYRYIGCKRHPREVEGYRYGVCSAEP